MFVPSVGLGERVLERELDLEDVSLETVRVVLAVPPLELDAGGDPDTGV
jgi:hypothetical protein